MTELEEELFLIPLAALWSLGRHEEAMRLVAQKFGVSEALVHECLQEMIRDGEI